MVSPDGVAPSRIVGVCASVNLPLCNKVQKFSSGTGSPGWSRKKGRKMVVFVKCTYLSLFYGHYTGQPALAGTPSQELENFVGAKFYCLHALSEGN